MGWRSQEVWLEADVLWFREQPRRPFGAVAIPSPAFAGSASAPALPFSTGLAESRQRRLQKQAARRRRLATRTVPAVALVLGSSTMLPLSILRGGDGTIEGGPLQEDPPSLTFRLDPALGELPASLVPRATAAPAPGKPRARKLARSTEAVTIDWQRATSIGLHSAGRLVDGTRLPVEGPDWVTWNPITDSSPNAPHRLFGHERTIRAILSVTAAHRAAHPGAPRVVIGDVSLRDGGPMREHVSHENGLDVDVYYPRLDRRLEAPTGSGQVDRRLAQDLLDRFVAAGAETVFVGHSTGLAGPGGVVVPYPHHDDHMHVRFPSPG